MFGQVQDFELIAGVETRGIAARERDEANRCTVARGESDDGLAKEDEVAFMVAAQARAWPARLRVPEVDDRANAVSPRAVSCRSALKR